MRCSRAYDAIFAVRTGANDLDLALASHWGRQGMEHDQMRLLIRAEHGNT